MIKMAFGSKQLDSRNSTTTTTKRRKFIWELPAPSYMSLCKILDQDRKWEELGGYHMNYEMNRLQEFGTAVQYRESPSQKMLQDWGCGNHTIEELFVLLAKMGHKRAMSVLKEYVHPKFHSLLHERDNPVYTIGISREPTESSAYSWTNGASGMSVNKDKLNPQKGPVQDGSSEILSDDGLDGDSNSTLKGGACAAAKLGVESMPAVPTDNHYISTKQTAERNNNNNNGLKPNTHQKRVDSHSQQRQKEQCTPVGHGTSTSSHDQRQPFVDSSSSAYSSISVSSRAVPPKIRIENSSGVDPATRPTDNDENCDQRKATGRETSPKPQRQRQSVSSMKIKNSSPTSSGSMTDSAVPFIDYAEIVAATGHFDRRRELGKGGFGVVYKGLWKNTTVAVKRIVKHTNPGLTSYEEAKLQQSYLELRALTSYRHDNILMLFGYSESNNELCLVCQYMDNGSLEDRLRRKNNTPPLSWNQRLHIACGSACGIQFLHTLQKALIHGDIKSANILLDKNLDPKIGDFGLAHKGPANEHSHTVVSSINGTRHYLPPEYLRNHQLSTKVDTYSFGIVLFEIATGMRVYDEKRGKGKEHLIDYVIGHKENSSSLLIRDKEAGTADCQVFEKFIEVGYECIRKLKKQRPEMENVFSTLNEYSKSKHVSCMPEINPDSLIRQIHNIQLNNSPKPSIYSDEISSPLRNHLNEHQMSGVLMSSCADPRDYPDNYRMPSHLPISEAEESMFGTPMIPMLTALGMKNGGSCMGDLRLDAPTVTAAGKSLSFSLPK